jgi:hypothetical protein
MKSRSARRPRDRSSMKVGAGYMRARVRTLRWCVLTALATIAMLGSVASPAGADPKPKLVSISVTPTNPVIPRDGHTVKLTATGTFSDGSTLDISNTLTWSTSNIAAALVDSSGVASTVLPGTATITARTPMGKRLSGSTTITVTDYTSLLIVPDPPHIDPVYVALGDAAQLRAIATYTDASTVDLTNTVTWTSTATNVASVDSQGVVTTAVATGTATITARYNSALTDTIRVNVLSAELRRVDITPDSVSASVGGSVQFIAAGTYSDRTTQVLVGSCSPADQQVLWSSTDPSAVDISCTGLATVTAGTPGDTITIQASTTETAIAPTGVPHSVTLSDATTLVII